MLGQHGLVLLNIKVILNHQGILQGRLIPHKVRIHGTVIVARVLSAVEATVLCL
jgi:hypothetical protein